MKLFRCRFIHFVIVLIPVFCHSQMPALAQAANSPDPAQVKDQLNKILSSSEFQVSKPEQNAVTQAWKWISEKWDVFWRWLKEIFRTIFSSKLFGGGSAGIQWVLITIFVMIGIYIIYRLVVNFKNAALEIKSDNTPSFSIVNESMEHFEDPDDLEIQAEKLAASSKYKEALHAIYYTALIRLNNAGVVEYRKSRTNGEYTAQLKLLNYSEVAAPFFPLTELFDRKWYGQKFVSKEDFEISRTYTSNISSLLRSLPAITRKNSAAPDENRDANSEEAAV